MIQTRTIKCLFCPLILSLGPVPIGISHSHQMASEMCKSIVDIKIIWRQQYRQNILETAFKSEAVIRGHQYAVVRPPVTMRKFYRLEISHRALGSNSQ